MTRLISKVAQKLADKASDRTVLVGRVREFRHVIVAARKSPAAPAGKKADKPKKGKLAKMIIPDGALTQPQAKTSCGSARDSDALRAHSSRIDCRIGSMRSP